MDDFEEKLNALLSSPENMQQVAQLAQMLSSQSSVSSPQAAPPPSESAAGGAADGFSLPAGLDLAAISRFLPLLQELNAPCASNERTQLLYALKPFLKPERQEKIDHALRLSHMFHMGRIFFKGLGEGHV